MWAQTIHRSSAVVSGMEPVLRTGKDEREPLSEPLFALPTILLFAPDVYVIELVSVHAFVVQPGSSCPETYCFVLLRTVLPCFGTSPRISIASMSA